ncbi:hypothetical protein FXB39_08650 [Nocardioides sp. BGMRC 2183]|nr:hypothetical protein FXB39_08650 [Nocardioides sp. BGMRC 2183]
MKFTRLIAATGSTLALVAGGVCVALVGGSGTASAAGQPSSAFGLELTGAGTAVIDRIPSVTSKDGKQVEDSLIAIPDNPLLTGGVVNVSARNGKASSSVTDLGIGGGILEQAPQLAELFTQLQPACDALDQIPLGTIADQIIDPATGTLLPQLLEQVVNGAGQAGLDLSLVTALDLSELLPDQLGDLCDLAAGSDLIEADAVTSECNGNTGTVAIADLAVAGLSPRIDTNAPNKSVSIPGLLTLTVNRQTKNSDGTFTVDALYLNLFDQVELTVASSTCGEVTSRTPNPEDPDDPSDAPTPTDPITTNAPVTG